MPEIIAISPGDILVEFDNGPFANTVPLKRLIFEKQAYSYSSEGCTTCHIHVDGVFDVGSEYLNSVGENPLDGLLINRTPFNVKSIARQNDDVFKHHIYDELKNLIIYKVKTIVPTVGGTITKRYYFATDDSWSRTDIEVPENDVQEMRITNLHEINFNSFTSDQKEELRQFIDNYFTKMIHYRGA